MKKAFRAFALIVAVLLALQGGIAAAETETVDLDLSGLSGTLVYAQIYQMALHPEDYMGKVIRLSGWFDAFEDSVTHAVYTVCYIPDASACCAQGIEFIWAEGKGTEAYPPVGTEITVTGRFETYLENDWEYMHLVDAEVLWNERDM